MIRLRLELTGRLQGVGFRPLMHRLAGEFAVTGGVRNTGRGVTLEIQGEETAVRRFSKELAKRMPSAAFIRDRHESEIECVAETGFTIHPSDTLDGLPTAEILPDLAMCPACAAEFGNPADRRFRYPFINCTDCGPRYTIIRQLPYDRENTTMAQFDMCDECRAEYRDPWNRRFHAQAVCCPSCGPELTLLDPSGEKVAAGEEALKVGAQAIRRGGVVAALGVGGFHLLCDARQDEAVARLRARKRRRAKPFALMVPNLDHGRRLCQISALEENILSGPGAPIVLLDRKFDAAGVSELIAPGLASLGVMLPYSPLHALIMGELDGPVVATSGNLSEEPLCYEIDDGLERLCGMADFFLVHDRPIASRVDDSVVRVIDGEEVVLRAGRGYAPLVLEAGPFGFDGAVLAFGAQQKNTLAFARGGRIVLLPHVGDLSTPAARAEYDRTVDAAIARHGLSAARPVCDPHPDYQSTRVALARNSDCVRVQHHVAHVLSCAAEHGLTESALGVAWDGTGYGADGTIWGGEFFFGSPSQGYRRVARFRPFALPGAEAAVKEPRRVAFSLLHELGESLQGVSEEEARVWSSMIKKTLNSPRCSSVGRLFDGVSALLGLANGKCDFEGQAAVLLETMAAVHIDGRRAVGVYAVPFTGENLLELDWEPAVRGILADMRGGLKTDRIAAKLHATLATAVVDVARATGASIVLLSGGCFQNRLLSEWTLAALRETGVRAVMNRRIPPNDGGVSVGQALGGMHVLVGSGEAALY